MLFSEREGYVKKNMLKIDQVNYKLKTLIWNIVYTLFYSTNDSVNTYFPNSYLTTEVLLNNQIADKLIRDILNDILYLQLDDLDGDTQILKFKRIFFSSYIKWHNYYDIVELTYNEIIQSKRDKALDIINKNLELGDSTWRMNNEGILNPITDKEEIQEIERASGYEGKFEPVSTHLKAARAHISRRPVEESSYRNSVSESINALESLCRIITGNENITGGKGIRQVGNILSLHPALFEGYNKIYGYSSKTDGIRHALCFGDKEVTYNDAKFFILSISAFINYLIAKVNESES